MASSAVLRAVRTFWTHELGADRSALDAPGTTVAVDDRASEVMVVEILGAVIVAAPSRIVDQLRMVDAEQLTTLDGLANAVGPWLDRALGINHLNYAAAGSLRAPPVVDTRDVISIDPTDPRLAALKARVAPAEWEEATMDEAFDQLVAVVRDGEIVAIAGYEDWDGLLAQVAVLTAPAHRGQGLAAFVGGVAARAGVARGLVAQWRVRPENHRSAAVAGRLGFERLGVQLAVAVRN